MVHQWIKGELAVGINAMVAFIPWMDITMRMLLFLVRIIEEDTLHFSSYLWKDVDCRELKHGNEEITNFTRC